MMKKYTSAFGLLLLFLSLSIFIVGAQEIENDNLNINTKTEKTTDTKNRIAPKDNLNTAITEMLQSENYSPGELELLNLYLNYGMARNRHYIAPCNLIDKEELLLTKRLNNLIRTFFRMPRCKFKTGEIREVDNSFKYNGYMYRY